MRSDDHRAHVNTRTRIRVTGLWPATYRYLEPLDEVAANVVALARPGDLVVCQHPSFYFHVRYLRDWDDWTYPIPAGGKTDSQVTFGSIAVAATSLDRAERVIFVRTVSDKADSARSKDCDARLSDGFDLRSEDKYLQDTASDLKMRFVGYQPRWRVLVQLYERKARDVE